ncbi:delta-60 repeat domain-containing protein [Ottowia flava]|uniref:Delta-60 repeat domain-containing protein n=1 Tax=Ottowia flava TaxID=2675430 RepID=A0ABW4KS89_9BURK|nr:fibronectin type III domain-containing protein [Ottowia sp. GY511]
MSAQLPQRLLRRWRALFALVALALGAVAPVSAAWVTTPWAPEAGEVFDIVPHANAPTQGILVGGAEFFGSGTLGKGIVRLNAATLAQDTGFTASVTQGANAGEVHAIAVQSDGKIVIGGRFDAVNGVARSNIARLNVDGTLDATYTASVTAGSEGILTMVMQPDNSVLIGGGFTQVNSTARDYLARLTPAGALDAGFSNPALDNQVRTLALQPDGAVLAGGFFNVAHGQPRDALVRLTANGSLDTTFANPAITGWVNALYLQPNGQLLVGGSLGTIVGAAREGLARLNANGTLDAGFTVDADGSVHDIVSADASRVVIVGGFENVAGTPLRRVARINYSTGALDPTLTDVGVLNAGFITYTAFSRSPTDVLIGGWFALVDGQSRSNLAQIVEQAGAPLAPSITQTQGLNSGAMVTVAAPADTGSGPVTGYNVTCTPMGPGAPVTASGLSPVALTGMVNGTPYQCVARAVNAAGAGPASAPAMVTPTADGGVVPVPTLSIGALVGLALGCGALMGWRRGRAIRS